MDADHSHLASAAKAHGLLAADLLASAARYAAASKAPNTLKAYGSAWRGFSSWCQARDLACLPAHPTTVAGYLASRAEELRASSLGLHVVAIAEAHRLAGCDSPTRDARVQAVLKGIRRAHGTRPTKKAAVNVPDLRAMVTGTSNSLAELRDRALLLLTWAAALRRSEATALDASDLTFRAEGLILVVRRSKTDQDGESQRVAVGYGASPSTCPVIAVRRWLAAAHIDEGPIFRPVDRHGHVRSARLQPRAVARIVKRLGESVGLNPTKLGGHSLRSGFATSAARAGLSEREIARTTRHQSVQVLRGYIQEGTMFEADAVRRVGL